MISGKTRLTIPAATVLMIFASLTVLPVADAHRVVIFAWTEGDTVHTVSKFPGGRKVSNSPVTVHDKEGNRLLEGKTNDQGEFSFRIPKAVPLTIVLDAGAGHQGEWRLSGEEITAALGKTETSGTPAPPPDPGITAPETRDSAPADSPKEDSAGMPTSIADPREIEAVVERVLDRKLQPIKAMLADMHDPGPSLTDIFGGIGYILGLFGIAAYVASRKNKG